MLLMPKRARHKQMQLCLQWGALMRRNVLEPVFLIGASAIAIAAILGPIIFHQ